MEDRYKMKKLRQLQWVAIKFLVKLRYQHRKAGRIHPSVGSNGQLRWWLMTSHRLELCRRFAKVVKIIFAGRA